MRSYIQVVECSKCGWEIRDGWCGDKCDGRGKGIMRSIYLKKPLNTPVCPSCGSWSKVSYPVGWTLGGEPVYSCKDKWHKRTIRQGEL